MMLRRAFFIALLGGVVVLPLWLVLARAFILGIPGSQIPLLTFGAVLLFAAMAVVAGLCWARKSVREDHAFSRLDYGVISAWYVSIVIAGLVEHGAISIPMILLGVVAFWSSAWQLFTEIRRRVKGAFERLEHTVAPAREYYRQRPVPPATPRPDAPGAGRVIRIDPPQQQG
jgi:hypothetical protein